jgi:predicted Zn finger-like uncharacterized protein
MDAVMRATCPSCKSSLRIPAQWAGQAVKCKKCGTVVRTKASASNPPAAPPPPPAAAPVPPAPLTVPTYHPSDPTAEATGPLPQAAPNGYAPPAYAPPAAPGYGYPAAPGYPSPDPGYPSATDAPPYPYPAPAAPPAPAPLVDFTPTSEATQAYRGRGKYRKGSGKGKFVWIGIALLLTAGLAVGGVFFGQIRDKFNQIVAEASGQGGDSNADPGNNTPQSDLLSHSGPFPRRLLFMHVSNYLYLNPLTNAAMVGETRGPDRTRAAALRLAYEWRVPTDKDNNQVFVLSDTAPPPDNRMPMKSVITGTYEQFFDTSRPQDRIVIYFGGHVVTKEKDGAEAVYLVPLEGDPEEEGTLIPLADFYGKLAACKATQKVVIWDVCRFNPNRGRIRPGSEPMTEAIAKALAAAPAGVQVITTCQPGENALEFYNHTPDGNNKPAVVGSSFLEASLNIANKQKAVKNLAPNDPIPVSDWTKAIGERVSYVGQQFQGSPKQTVKITGATPANLVAYNKEESPAVRFDIPSPPKGANPDEVARIAGEFALPGIKSDDGASGVASFPFPADVLADFKEDVPLTEIMNPANEQKYFFRRKVLDAFQTIRDVWGKDGARLREEFVGETSDVVKKQILEEQIFPAEAIPKLELAITLLEAVADQKDLQPKRWQAHYDYALAQCKARLAFMQEYNLALGSIRTEVLPPLDPKQGQDGYKLISSERMKVKEKTFAEEAKEIYDSIIDDYKGTPWAVQAKRDRVLSLGLAWQPFNSKAMAEKDGLPVP